MFRSALSFRQYLFAVTVHKLRIVSTQRYAVQLQSSDHAHRSRQTRCGSRLGWTAYLEYGPGYDS